MDGLIEGASSGKPKEAQQAETNSFILHELLDEVKKMSEVNCMTEYLC